MAQYVGVSFRRQGQIYFFLSAPFVFSLQDMVLVKTEEGIGFGTIVALRDELPAGVSPEMVKPIYRPATPEDVEIWNENHIVAPEALKYCQECAATLSLDMKVVDVEIYFAKSKMIFYFTAPGRVDFRDLVKELVRNYRTRIELRQVGVRHETQMVGALGNCGQVCCCRRYLRHFEPVTIKMAKDQNLFLNPVKISGVCGRLLCCLAYEKDTYAEFQRRAPRVGRRYTTTQGGMKALRVNMFRDSVSVLTEAGDELEFSLTDWTQMLKPDAGRGVNDTLPEDDSVEQDSPAESDVSAQKQRPPRPAKFQHKAPRPQAPERPAHEVADKDSASTASEEQTQKGPNPPRERKGRHPKVRRRKSPPTSK